APARTTRVSIYGRGCHPHQGGFETRPYQKGYPPCHDTEKMMTIDHDAYWSALDAELAEYPAAPELEYSPLRQTDYASVYHLKITSIGPYRLFGYLSVPT